MRRSPWCWVKPDPSIEAVLEFRKKEVYIIRWVALSSSYSLSVLKRERSHGAEGKPRGQPLLWEHSPTACRPGAWNWSWKLARIDYSIPMPNPNSIHTLALTIWELGFLCPNSRQWNSLLKAQTSIFMKRSALRTRKPRVNPYYFHQSHSVSKLNFRSLTEEPILTSA